MVVFNSNKHILCHRDFETRQKKSPLKMYYVSCFPAWCDTVPNGFISWGKMQTNRTQTSDFLGHFVLCCMSHYSWRLPDFRASSMAMSSVLYHYTSKDALFSILDSGIIFPSQPHPATPGRLAGVNLNAAEHGSVFFTRMDPKNNKNSIAFNNFRFELELFVFK